MPEKESFDIDGLMVFKGNYTAKDQDGNVVPSVITPDRYKQKEREPLSSEQTGRYTNTTAYWKDHSDIVPAKGDVYIYTDGGTTTQGGVTVNVPKIKVGDGVTSIDNLPFTDSDNQGGGEAGTLDTTNTSAQTPAASESLSGNVNLHKVSKTGSYDDLLNKPTIPTVNDAVLTIQRNGTTVDTFSANASVDKTIDIEIPVDIGDLNNVQIDNIAGGDILIFKGGKTNKFENKPLEVVALPSGTKYGASLSLSIDSSTYIVTAQLLDQDGNNLGNAQTIDLPLESVVVSGSYNAQTKKVVLTLQNGSTIEFSVADLVAGLQSEITAQNPLSADLVVDGTNNKAFTAAEKTKLSGIEAGAEVNVQADWNQSDSGDDDYIKNKPTIPTVNDSTITILSNNEEIDNFTLNAADDSSINIPDTDFVYVVTSHSNNTLTAVSKSGQPPITGYNFVYFPSNITLTTSSTSEINITLKVGSSGTAYPIIVDGVVIKITNSEPYTFNKGLYFVQLGNYWFFDTQGCITINGIRFSCSYYDLDDAPELSAVATSGDYDDLTNKPTIPAAQIQSDWAQTDNTKKDYIKNKPTIPAAQVNADWNATSGAAQILNKPTIPTVPTNVSAFTNDAGYLTAHQTIRTMCHEQLTDSSLDDINIHDGFYFPNAVQDYDGNWYGAVVIGDQVWLGENLRTTHYSDGVALSYRPTNTSTKGYFYPNDSADNVAQYGLLYNIPGALNGSESSDAIPSGVQGVSPNGWHIPSKGELNNLFTYIGNQTRFIYDNDSSKIAKSISSTFGWNSSNYGYVPGNVQINNNKTGLNLVPAGYFRGGSYSNLLPMFFGEQCHLVDTTYSSLLANEKYIRYNYATVNQINNSIHCGYSVRCVSDLTPIQFRNWYIQQYGSLQHHLPQEIPAQEQSDWSESDTTDPAYIKNKPQNIVTDANYVHTDNNYTATEKNKLAGIESGAEVNVQSDWEQTENTADDYIKNKPSLATVATSGSYNDLDNKPTIPSAPGTLDTTSEVSLETSANEDLSGNIKLHEVSKTGDYNDLSHKLEEGDNILIRNTHLPIGYEELEYIRNSQSTRVNTGISADVDNIKVELVVKPSSGVWRIFQSAGSSSNICGLAGDASGSIMWRYRGNTVVTSSMQRNTEHYMLIQATAANGSAELYVKDLYTGDESTNTGTYTYGTIGYPTQFSLFGNIADLYSQAGNMVSSLKFWVNDVLRLDCVPCKRMQDDVVGFYNKVSDNLITEYTGNLNAGTLAKNNVINVTGLAEVATSGDYNDLSNKPTIPTIPTNISAFTNDAGYITQETDPTVPAWAKAANKPSYDYSEIDNTPSIPSATSDLTNDSGFITLNDIPSQEQSDWNESDTTDPSYIKNKPTIPTVPSNVSAFTNDAGYITNSDLPTIDTVLSETSTNPVQNKAIGTELRKLWDKVDIVPRLDNEYVRHNLFIVSQTNNKWGGTATSNYKHWIVPVSNMREVIITSNANTQQAYSFFKSYSTPVSGDTPDYATGYDGIKAVSAGETLRVTVPPDAEYLYINTGNNGAAKAAHIYLTGVGITEHNGTSSQYVMGDGSLGSVGSVTIYSGSSSPASATGADGDIYIQEVV